MAIAFPFAFLIEWLRSSFTERPGLHLIIHGMLMIVIMLHYPAGFAGLYEWAKARPVSLFSRGRTTTQEAEA
jgi:hypothetical protein